MATEIVVTAATGVMRSLLSKLSLLLSDQYKNLKGVRRDIDFLNNELTEMNVVLEKLADMDKLDCQKKLWRDKVREMAYDIEDCIDIFMHQLGEGDDKDGLFHKTARKIRKLRVRHQIASKIQELKTHVVEQSASRARYKIDDESVSEPKVVQVDPRLPAMYEDAKRLVGIDGPREEIIKWLMEEGSNDSRQLRVVSIVGFGGLGKTTLANQVYAKIKNEFECTAFVSVSRTPHLPKILKDILSGVGYGGIMEDDVQKFIDILRARLTNKRYFIVIDDLWRIMDWDIIKCAFVENNTASRLITTTRTTSFIPNQGHIYQMQPLNELYSRRLFFKRLFDTEDSCPKKFKEISDQVLRKCNGVPLAIISIASLLANQMHIEVWEKIYNSLGSELDTNPTLEWMKHVLILSYSDLSHELKTCLLYLGMYPEDYQIPKNHLVRQWMAEGFVREKHGLDLEEAAENCFNELINRSMIQPCFAKGGFDEACQVHDLMLDLIMSKCKEENFVSIIDKKYPMNGASQVRRISHQYHDRVMPLTVESMSASTVRSYISFPAVDCIPPLSKFEFLRVLDMERSHSMDSMCLDLSAINHLFLLRHVRILGFCLKLPKKFGKLKHLMTLDMIHAWLHGSSKNQPSDFDSLSSLRHLSLPDHVVFKNGLRKLCNLRHLSCFEIGSNSMECVRDLGELTNLRYLWVRYSYSRPPAAVEDNLETILAASLTKLGNNNLCHLFFQVVSGSPSAQFWSNCLARPRHLHNLYLHRVVMPKLSDWIVYGDRLADVALGVQELRHDDVLVLGQLPCLACLVLIANTIQENNIIIHPNTFHSLKILELSGRGLQRLTFEPDAMPRLQSMYITLGAIGQDAMQLQDESPVGGIEHLASLERIFLHIRAKSYQGSKIESACRDAISRHPKSQAMKIDIDMQ